MFTELFLYTSTLQAYFHLIPSIILKNRFYFILTLGMRKLGFMWFFQCHKFLKGKDQVQNPSPSPLTKFKSSAKCLIFTCHKFCGIALTLA